MKLYTHEWGTGPKVAVLLHGIMSSGECWRQVAPALVEKEYRVIAVDLRGHGRSAHTGEYTLEDWGEDVLASIPFKPDLVIGHSLGGLILGTIVETLQPKRAIYVDPAFYAPSGLRALIGKIHLRRFIKQAKTITAKKVAKLHPRWSPEDIATEVRSFHEWDPQTAKGLTKVMHPPQKAIVSSLIVWAGDAALTTDKLTKELKDGGFEICTVPGTGHVIFRDDFAGFMRTIDDWI